MKQRWSCLAVSALTVLAVSGLVNIYQLSDRIYYNRGVLSVVVFALAMVMAEKLFQGYKENPRAAFWACLCAGLLNGAELMGLGMRLFANYVPVRLSGFHIVWMMISAVILIPFTEPVIYWLLTVRMMPEREPVRCQRIFFASWLIIFLLFLPCFFAFYPGLYNYDMTWQWEMYDTGVYSTHHPLIHTFLTGSLFELGNRLWGSYNAGFALHSILQLVVLSGCMAYGIRYLVKRRMPKKVWIAVLIFYGIFPFFPVLGVSTTKDTVFGGLFLVTFVSICDMVQDLRIWRGWRLGGFILAAVLMGAFRNNAVYGLACSMICFLLAAVSMGIQKKVEIRRFLLQLSLLLFIICAGTQLSLSGMKQALHASDGSVAEMLSVPMQQLARTGLYYENELTADEKKKLDEYFGEGNYYNYKYYVSDPVKMNFRVDRFEENPKAFFRFWLEMGKKHPGEYLLATLYNTQGLWYLGGDSSAYLSYKMFPSTYVWQDSRLPALRDFYCWFTNLNLERYLPLISMIFYTSFYSWSVLIGGVALIVKRRYTMLIPVMVLLPYMATLVLGPCMIVRYMLGVMLCVPILWAEIVVASDSAPLDIQRAE